MIKWFWRLYTATAVAAFLLVGSQNFGGDIEAHFAPVRSEQTITEVVRLDEPHELCWVWNSVKNRNLVSPDMDTFVETAHDHWVSSVFERDTQMPWGASRAVGLGPHVQRYCVLLPSTVTSTDTVTVHQRIYYPGFLGAWRIPVDVPDVVSPPAA